MSRNLGPKPWKHVDGERVSDFLPRPGYSDHEDGYISTRSPERAARLARADALAAKDGSATELPTTDETRATR